MKIIPGTYPEEKNWQTYIHFKYDYNTGMSLVFLRRLAAFCRGHGLTLTDALGYRSVSVTQRLWDADLKANGGKPSGKVARPGTSWHEAQRGNDPAGLAIDLNGSQWESISRAQWLPYSRLNQPDLNKYGIMLPLNMIDSPKVQEWWHIQPIETNGIAPEKRITFLDPDDLIVGKPRKARV